MAKGENQKLKLPLLERLLLRETDEEHPMSMEQILSALERQGVSAERKSIYRDMRSLEELGLDVQSRKGKEPGWFIGTRPFELPELKLLVDAVQSCKFITPGKSSALIGKLETLTSRYQAGELQRQVYVAGRAKTMNEKVYYTIDALHAAIAQGKGVGFYYFDYNVRREKVFRRGGARYEVSPKGLIWDNENYYLVGYDHQKGEVRHYRVDKMDRLEQAELPDEGRGPFDVAVYARKHFNMFSGREGAVTLRCREGLVGVILDRFGQDAILVPDGEGYFTVTVSAVVSPQFLGWLFGLEGGAVLIAPAWAVEEMKKQLGQVGAAYLPSPDAP